MSSTSPHVQMSDHRDCFSSPWILGSGSSSDTDSSSESVTLTSSMLEDQLSMALQIRDDVEKMGMTTTARLKTKYIMSKYMLDVRRDIGKLPVDVSVMLSTIDSRLSSKRKELIEKLHIRGLRNIYEELHGTYKQLESVVGQVASTTEQTRRPTRRLSDIEDGLDEMLATSMNDGGGRHHPARGEGAGGGDRARSPAQAEAHEQPMRGEQPSRGSAHPFGTWGIAESTTGLEGKTGLQL